MRERIEFCKKTERIMRIISMLCSIGIACIVFYMIGTMGALDCNMIGLKETVQKSVIAVLCGIFLFGTRRVAQFIRYEMAKKRIYMGRAWR